MEYYQELKSHNDIVSVALELGYDGTQVDCIDAELKDRGDT